MNDIKKDIIQKEALKAWISKGKVGTCEIITGLGKTFIGLHALYTMPKNDKLHLFLAETTERKKDVYADIKKYNKIFNRDVLKDYNLQFYCYQTAYKWKGYEFGLVIADEIHDALSLAYSKFFIKNKYDAIIGLSATIIRKTTYEVNDKIFTKGSLLDKIAPICYKYTLAQGHRDNTARHLNIYVINHTLDDKNKTVKSGSKKNTFYQTEQKAYSYWDNQHKRSWFIDDPDLKERKIQITAYKRKQLLYNLESKIYAVKILLKALKSKTIIFGNSIDALLKITPNVISSRNNDSVNDYIRKQFDSNKINVIGSFKKLKQGANLVGIDNCIIMSFYSNYKDLIQRVGRLRKNADKVGHVFIFVTKNTQEEIWFNRMVQNQKELNLINCDSVEDCINKLKNES